MFPLRYLADRLVDVWPHDSGPGTRRDDACRDGIGWPSEGAHDALESHLRRPIRPIEVPAGQARLRRMAGIDQHDCYPDTRRLVLHEGAKLLLRARRQLDRQRQFYRTCILHGARILPPNYATSSVGFAAVRFPPPAKASGFPRAQR